MSEQTQPGLAAWADLASIRRTLEWVGLDDARLASANYTGAGVLRLLARIGQHEGIESSVLETVEHLKTHWAGFDEGDLAHRRAVVDASRALLGPNIAENKGGITNISKHAVEIHINDAKPEK